MTQKVDIIIKNARVIDGTGKQSFIGNVAIKNNRIVETQDITKFVARHEIDAQNMVVAPGFIDCHTHDDLALLESPKMENKVTQGVTTVITGNCGISLTPFKPDNWEMPIPMALLGRKDQYCFPTVSDYVRALQTSPPAVNAALLCGHNTIRAEVMKGDIHRAANKNEIFQMQEIVRLAVSSGAIGLSSGLMYPAGFAAPTSEVTALANEAGKLGGLYATHLRDEGEHLISSVEEAAKIGKAANLPVILSHHKVTGRSNWGATAISLKKIDQIAEGQTIHLDVYPYIASATALIVDRLSIAEKILIVSSHKFPQKAGQYLGDIAVDWGISEKEAAEALLPAQAIYFAMNETDVRRVLSHHRTMIGSDGIPGSEAPHPRLWGTFPRVLGHYSRNVGLLSLESAVHKMTGLTASVFGFKDRGILKRGAVADITIFDPETIIDRATFEDPTQTSVGIKHVIIGGEVVLEDGIQMNTRPGRIVQRIN